MKAGREMDAAVAEKVMGRPGKWADRICLNGQWRDVLTWVQLDEDPANPMPGMMLGQMPPPYSTDIAAAWQVVERMVKHHDYLFSDAEWDGERSFAEFRLGGTGYGCFADLMPEAICLAALRAVGVEPSDED